MIFLSDYKFDFGIPIDRVILFVKLFETFHILGVKISNVLRGRVFNPRNRNWFSNNYIQRSEKYDKFTFQIFI